MSYTKDFTKETFLRRLESEKEDLRQYAKLARVETTFSALNIRSNLTRSTSTRGDFFGISRSDEDKKIEEGITLLVRKEKDGKKIFKCWNCNEFGHYASKYPKREKNIKGDSTLKEIEIEIICMQMEMKNLMEKVKVKVMINQDLWLSRKMILIGKLDKKEF